MMRDYNRELMEFIEASTCAYLTVLQACAMLENAGFEELKEKDSWCCGPKKESDFFSDAKLTPGKGYFVKRGDSALIAFYLPKQTEGVKGYHIAAAHGDSPCFKIKENSEIGGEGYTRLNVERYGGMILSTWLDRPLSASGRVLVMQDGKPKTCFIDFDYDLLVIPNMAIHMNRDINKGYEYKAQSDMLPVLCLAGETVGEEFFDDEQAAKVQPDSEQDPLDGKPMTLKALAAEQLGVEEDCICGMDLFLYNREKGRLIGANESMILSPRLDDLQCVFSGLKGFTEAVFCEGSAMSHIPVLAVFDNEEVGSSSRQGADSSFLEDVIERIALALDIDREKQLRMISESFLLSADNAHAVHPAHPEKADPTNRPKLNGGVVIKFHGGQKYTTDGASAAYVRYLAKKAGIPTQEYANHSDVVGGSTLGNIAVTHLSIPAADIGLAQLAMHSAMETAGAKDTEYMVRLMKSFFEN